MSDEKEKLRQKYELEDKEASSSSKQLPDAPPAYDDVQQEQNPYGNSYQQQQSQPPQHQFGYGSQNYPPPQPNQQHYQPDPMQDPNVYKIQPDLVNINYSPPEHLNPQYQEFKQNQQAKMARGEFSAVNSKPNINKGHTSQKTKIQSSFPGASGATYHNAANNH
ncbi:uncharacterized protein KGF55_001907 [Candida pseudojiufengensis]|uniref:uncharacterized protein n=1 Tax=Candida pseudojiufengensis TaxID=497109 RepID=UPI0022242D35|nr:uncharacterized protein KGF55_001907 [Candida pseudojiufengensis]KAI5964837.1 hypothetical protein KGF55_001907 [Candida pseudojiufengensis]